MARISVIIPVHNAAATLERALDSIGRQTFSDWEIIAVDDGSSDGSRVILDTWAAREARMRVVGWDVRRGVVAAHGAGLREARGEVIARMDADDRAHPRRFERQIGLLDEDPGLGAVACGVCLLDPEGAGMERYVDWVNRLLTPQDIVRERFIEAPVIHPSSMIRRSEVDSVDGYRDCGWPEDYDFWLRLLEGGCRIGKVAEILLDWQDGPDRLTRSHPSYRTAEVWRMKCHFLGRLDRVRGQGVAICGAGPIGKRCVGLLQGEGVKVRAVFDVDPAKIGRRVKGVEVLGPAEFGLRERDAVLLSAVGVEGGRERVRRLAEGAGYREGEDFWCLC